MKYAVATAALLLSTVPTTALAQSTDNAAAPRDAQGTVRIGAPETGESASAAAAVPAPRPSSSSAPGTNVRPAGVAYGGASAGARYDYEAPPPSGGVYAAPTYARPRVRVFDYEGGPVPAGARLEHRRTDWLVYTGGITWGGMYFSSLIYALATCGAGTACRDGSAWLYMPVVGPFITAAMAPTTGGQALAIFDGAVQTLSIASLIAGFAIQRQVVVFRDYAQNTARRPSFSVSPGASGASAGMTVTMTHF